MPILNFDFRFLELEYEISLIEEFRGRVEALIQQMAREGEERLKSLMEQHGGDRDSPEVQSEMRMLHAEVEEVLPRYRGAFLIVLWSVLECAIKEVSRYVAKEKCLSLRLEDSRGDNRFDQWRKYYHDVLHYSLPITDVDWSKLRKINEIRHAYAHANGRLEMLKHKLKEKISRWERDSSGISTTSGYIVISEEFTRDATSLVCETVARLLQKVRADFPNSFNKQ